MIVDDIKNLSDSLNTTTVSNKRTANESHMYYHGLYSDGTHDLLYRQKMSKFGTFSRKYSISMSMF